MAEARTRSWTLQLEHQFDRLLPEKLAQAYQYLLPDEVGKVGDAPVRRPETSPEVLNAQASRYLCARVF